jgi:hypothetical protein
LTLIATAFATPAHAQDAAPNRVLFTNVNVFDGHSDPSARTALRSSTAAIAR